MLHNSRCFNPNPSQIDQRSTIPVVAICVVTVFAALLSLINIGNSAAFNGTISLVLEGFYLSYLLAIGLLLWRRLRGDLDNQNDELNIFNSSPYHPERYDRSLTWGPWRLRGKLGVANNAVAICYLLLIIFFSFWPTQINPSAEMMNWAVVVTGGVATFSVVYYVLYARKSYTGPVVDQGAVLRYEQGTL
jgi:choline transport protein